MTKKKEKTGSLTIEKHTFYIYIDTFQGESEEVNDLKPTSSEQDNQRLAFVHYVYPKTSQKSHFKQFEEN